nr:extensin-like [Penaeus vannamei]
MSNPRRGFSAPSTADEAARRARARIPLPPRGHLQSPLTSAPRIAAECLYYSVEYPFWPSNSSFVTILTPFISQTPKRESSFRRDVQRPVENAGSRLLCRPPVPPRLRRRSTPNHSMIRRASAWAKGSISPGEDPCGGFNASRSDIHGSVRPMLPPAATRPPLAHDASPFGRDAHARDPSSPFRDSVPHPQPTPPTPAPRPCTPSFRPSCFLPGSHSSPPPQGTALQPLPRKTLRPAPPRPPPPHTRPQATPPPAFLRQKRPAPPP